jgi:hypothetical protein
MSTIDQTTTTAKTDKPVVKTTFAPGAALPASAPAKSAAAPAKVAVKVAAKPKAVAKPAAKPVANATAKPVVKVPAPAAALPKPAAKSPAKAPAKPKAAKAVKAPKVVKPPKAKKPKMVRDSMTMPKAEYAVIDELKLRAAKLDRPVKKTEILRAGIKALAAMADVGFLVALKAVPSLKTGRPSKS